MLYVIRRPFVQVMCNNNGGPVATNVAHEGIDLLVAISELYALIKHPGGANFAYIATLAAFTYMEPQGE